MNGVASTSEVLDRVSRALALQADLADGRALAVRIDVTGPMACHDEIAANPDHWVQEIRALASVVTSDVWIEKVRFATARPADLSALAARDDAMGSLLRKLGAGAGNADETAALRTALVDMRGVLPPDLLAGVDALDLNDPDLIGRLAAEARELLLARIAREGSPR